jgi:hypothetical protein
MSQYKFEPKLLIENVKGYAGDNFDIYVVANVYGYVVFDPVLTDRTKVRNNRRYIKSCLGFEQFLKRYPSLKPRQKELFDKVRELLPGAKLF